MRKDRSTVTGSGWPARWSPLILDSIRKAIGSRVGTHQVHVGSPVPDGDHPGWNISDEIDLPPHGECRYVVELVCGQMAFAEVASAHPVVISVWDDDDYDRSQEGECRCDTGFAIQTFVCDGSMSALGFPTLRTGAYDIVVSNAGDQSTHVTVCITAPAARPAAKGPGRESGLRVSAFAIGETRAVLAQQGRRP